jgi:histidine ammonia-lyase
MHTVVLDGASLTLGDLHEVAAGEARVELAPAAREAMQASRALVERLAGEDAPVYGVNTGFGSLATVRVPPSRLDELQVNLLRSHCAGVGPPLPRRHVRAAMTLRANALARGHSGIRPSTVETLLALINAGIHPVVPSQGSVGASGDLAPLAHIALALAGEGRVEQGGRDIPAALALAEAGIPPVRLAAKEGIALINGTQLSTALGALLVHDAEELAHAADISGAMTLEALKGSVQPFASRVQEVRPHAGQARVAESLRLLTAGSAIIASHAGCGRVQDSYALRCMPQVHGAVRDTLAHARSVLLTEANASTDNPLVFADSGEIISCGNFHGAPVGYVLDFAAIALADLAAIAERRIERLLNPALSALPPFLAAEPGLESGLMMVQVTAAALVSENKGLAHPASVDSIPTSADKEDHVPMSAWAARKALRILDNARFVVAIELLAGLRALDFLKPLTAGAGVEAARSALRDLVPARAGDHPPAPHIERLARAIDDGSLRRAVQAAVGTLP